MVNYPDIKTARYKIALACVAVVVIGVLEALALFSGVNGAGLSAAVGSIFGVVGFVFGRRYKGDVKSS